MTDVRVLGGSVSATGTRPGGGTEVQGFVFRYDDERPVAGRPDNTGRAAAAADVAVTTFGGVALGAYPTRSDSGVSDLMLWVAVQRGRWYDDDHRAYAVAVEAGHQWTDVTGAPWVRGGLFIASGDNDPEDGRHGTFFPMLPTVRRFSQTTVYSTMNLHEFFGQVLLRPGPALGVRLDVHHVRLATPSDRWYAGSGATLTSGGGFGFAGRPSLGGRTLGTTVEASVDYAVTPRWSVNGFLAAMRGGDVVDRQFDGRQLWFAYVENVLRWTARR
jgi:hypothetical protein